MKRMVKLLVTLLVVGAVWAGMAYNGLLVGRQAVEAEMREKFAQLGCEPRYVRDDVCIQYPDEGRCVSGEYLDYRTEWNGVRDAEDFAHFMQARLDELGSTRALLNWLACQGFHGTGRSLTAPQGYKLVGPQIWRCEGANADGDLHNMTCTFRMLVRWINATGPIEVDAPVFPLGSMSVGSGGVALMRIANDNAVLGTRILFNNDWKVMEYGAME